MQKLNPASLCAPIGGLYSQIVVAPPGQLAFISGQVALDANGTLVGTDHREQAVQCFRNIAAALAALDAGPHQVVKMTINVVDHHAALIDTIFGAGRDVFGEDWPVTASTLIGVAALGLPEWLIEVDAVLSVPE